MSAFNDFQQNTLRLGCQDIHERMAELAGLVAQADERSPFSRYVADLTPVERRVLRDYFSRIRQTMFDLLEAQDIPIDVRSISLRWAVLTGLSFLEVSVDEMGPEKLRGYGALSDEGRTAALRIQQELHRLIEQAARYLRAKSGGELQQRLARIQGAAADLRQTVCEIDAILTRHALVELRPQLDLVVQRLESPQLEIAVFGRVSSGKSSLLNHVAGRDVLPVGVTPITAVPTRLTWGEQPAARIEFALSSPQQISPEEIAEFASEEQNPGNFRHVTRIEVRLPSPRLRSGVVFVDTPGIGSLARSGSAETFAYLPRCDLGVVLVDASSALNDEDLDLLRLLREAATPVEVLLSKADLLGGSDRERTLRYIQRQIGEQLEESLPVFPVSIVGQDERLLTEWFDRQIAPRTERHLALVGDSLRRKVVRLAESALTVLELRRDRRSLGGSPAQLDEIKTQLTQADDALREAEFTVGRWSDEEPLKEGILSAIAQRIANDGRPSDTFLAVVSEAIQEGLAARSQLARQRMKEVQGRLLAAVEHLAEIARPLPVEAAVVRDVPLAGLPPPAWTPPAELRPLASPWWARLAPSWAVHAVFRDADRSLGNMLERAIRSYDEQLRTWMREKLRLLKAAYDSQAEIVRQQLRRGGDQFGHAADPAQLAEDISRLQCLAGGEASPAAGPATEAPWSELAEQPQAAQSSP
jgi:GTP-binding protein EngB required for normal cell division